MADKKSFMVYLDYEGPISKLSDAESGQLFKALFAYASTGEAPVLEGATAIAFEFIRAQMDRDTEKWESSRQAHIEAGRRGGNRSAASRRSSKAEVNEAKPSVASNDEANEANSTVTVTVEDTVTDTVEDIITPPTPSKRGRVEKVDPFVEFAGDDAEMAEALSGFEEMRKKMRKPMTDRAKTLLLAKLEKLSPDRAGQIALLDEATAKNWLSVYDGSDYNRVSHAPSGSKGDEWDRLIASYGGYDEGGKIIDITEHG